MKPIQIGDVVGDYRVIDIAGSGGMGAVYKIEHGITRRIEAMKLLPPGSSGDPEQVRRFEREIQVQARLHHPHIVALYNAIRAGDSMALVMEFVEGESLQRMLEAGPLPVETAVDYACQILHALAYAHDAGVIHRDVAPANIIVTPDRMAKLTDFGLARGVADVRVSTAGVPLGSPWYMSPEQVRGVDEIDLRTDLYAMGAVLHEMLTGRKLFDVEGAFAVMQAHLDIEPALPSSENPTVPAALDHIVRRALAKDPEGRFRSADEFRLALESGIAGVGPQTVPSGMVPRLISKLGGLHPSRAAVLMALAPAALLAGFCTIRFLPTAARAPAIEGNSQPAAIAKVDGTPELPALVAPDAPIPPEEALVIPLAHTAMPATKEKVVGRVRQRARIRVPVKRPDSQPQPNYAIRVTGGELPPPVVIPVSRSVPPSSVASLGPCIPATDSPEAVRPETSLTASGSPRTPQEPQSARPQNSGNRFLRALGKLNPFRKTTKPDANQSPTPPLK